MKKIHHLVLVISMLLSLVMTGCNNSEGESPQPSDAPPTSEETPATKETTVLSPPDVSQIDYSSIEAGTVFQTLCITCHGTQGEGNLLLQSPSIAGLPAWYVKEQMEKFKTGLRGAHKEDIQGNLMRAISQNLTPEQIEEAALFTEKLSSTKTAMNGDVASIDRGRKIFANECMECHRYNGRGEVVFHSAPLTTLNREYLVSQLHKYREGWRGNAKDDFYGQKMVMVAGTLSDRSIEDIVNYIGALAHGDDPRPAMY